jgi:hypothetical protein
LIHCIEEATIAPLTVQDCQVSGWTNPTGAIRLGSGPVVLFDCVFTRPPTRHPPIVLSGGQRLVLSNNRSTGTDALVKPGDSGRWISPFTNAALRPAIPS